MASWPCFVELSFHTKFQPPRRSRSGANILARDWMGLTVIIVQVSVQIGLNWYWTGTELGNKVKRHEVEITIR